MGKQKLIVKGRVGIPAIVGEKVIAVPQRRFPKYDKEALKRKKIWIPLTCKRCGEQKYKKHNFVTRFLNGDVKRFRCTDCMKKDSNELQNAINALNIRKARAKGLIK